MNKICVGYARREINPPTGIWLIGYGSRTKACEGVHDSIYASAAALSDGEKTVLLIALDVCMVNAETSAAIKDAIREEVGIGAADIFINTSHTHSGPTTGKQGKTPASEQYYGVLVRRTTEAAVSALKEVKAASFGFGRARLDIGCNRREEKPSGEIVLGVNPAGPRLAEVTVWNFARKDAEDVVVFSAPIHAATLGPSNYLTSGDWPGAAVRHIEKKIPGVRAVFLQGCAADQNPYHQGGSFEHVEEHGAATAEAVALALKNMTPANAVPIKTVTGEMQLPLAEGGTHPCPIHGVRLGDAVLLGIGAEVFVEYALFGREKSRAKTTLILGYTDDCIGYIPVDSAYLKGGYETVANKNFALGKLWKPGVEAATKEGIARMIAELAKT